MTVTHPAPNSSTFSANVPPIIPGGELLPLEMLQPGETGVVMELVGADEQIHRLKELGLREGVTICVIKRGEPSLIAINDQRLSLRLDPSLMILVEMK